MMAADQLPGHGGLEAVLNFLDARTLGVCGQRAAY
jgi:hypothetical protein